MKIYYKDKKVSVELTSVFDLLINNQIFNNGGNDEAVLDYWRFTTFTLRYCFSYEKQHSVKLFTGT